VSLVTPPNATLTARPLIMAFITTPPNPIGEDAYSQKRDH
jgi:hypothetical protein